MMERVNVFVGYDPEQQEGYDACVNSLTRFIPADWIVRLDANDLAQRGIFNRPFDDKQSTPFTYTRYLVPWLCEFKGKAMFCDGDFFWRRSPLDLFRMATRNSCAVEVVKHDLRDIVMPTRKMNGKPQEWYPKKNWSSMMIFHCEHEDNRQLTPELVQTASPKFLHRFEWTDKIGALPSSFNHLADYDYPSTHPHAVHFTNGGPWIEGYHTTEYADEWFTFVQERNDVYRTLERQGTESVS